MTPLGSPRSLSSNDACFLSGASFRRLSTPTGSTTRKSALKGVPPARETASGLGLGLRLGSLVPGADEGAVRDGVGLTHLRRVGRAVEMRRRHGLPAETCVVSNVNMRWVHRENHTK